MGVAQIPAGFNRVSAIEPDGAGIVLRSANGPKRVKVPVDVDFLRSPAR
jgi:hypothetical protein